jgi:hypothetical protein
MKQTTEYRVTYKDGDVDHIKRKDIKNLDKNEIEYVEKVKRFWADDGSLVDEITEDIGI